MRNARTQPPGNGSNMKLALVTIWQSLYLAAAMLACGAPPPEYGVFAETEKGLVEMKPQADGTYQTLGPVVRIVASDQVATTAAISRVELLRVKAETGATVRAQMNARPVVLEERGSEDVPVELTLTAVHPCCMGSLWRVEAQSLGTAQEFIVWANDAPGDTLEGD